MSKIAEKLRALDDRDIEFDVVLDEAADHIDLLHGLLTEAMTALGPYARLDEGWRDLEMRVDEALRQ